MMREVDPDPDSERLPFLFQQDAGGFTSIQKHVVRIVWMIPLYSIESFFALKYRKSAIYIRTFRECYESYVIYNFLYYLIALLGK